MPFFLLSSPPLTSHQGSLKIAFARSSYRFTWSYHLSFLFFTVVRWSSWGLMCFTAYLIVGDVVNVRDAQDSIRFYIRCIFLYSSAVSIHISHAFNNISNTSARTGVTSSYDLQHKECRVCSLLARI